MCEMGIVCTFDVWSFLFVNVYVEDRQGKRQFLSLDENGKI
jgi:hypothetical protein